MIWKEVELALVAIINSQLKQEQLRELKIQGGTTVDAFHTIRFLRWAEAVDNDGYYAQRVLSYAPAFGALVELIKEGWYLLKCGDEDPDLHCIIKTSIPLSLFYQWNEEEGIWKLDPNWDTNAFDSFTSGDYGECLEGLGLKELPETGEDEDAFPFFTGSCLEAIRYQQLKGEV